MALKLHACLSVASLIAAYHLPAQSVTIEGRLDATTSVLVRNRYTQTYSVVVSSQTPRLRSLLASSPDFDTYLVVVAPDGRVYADDDSGEGKDAKLELPSARNGEWLFIVTTYGARETGRFKIVVDGPAPRAVSGRSLPPAAIDSIGGGNRPVYAAAAQAAPVRVRVDTVRVTRTDTVRIFQSDPPGPSQPTPAFPWPPPQASAMSSVPLSVLRQGGRSLTTLRTISDVLEEALAANGYSERVFYSIPRGFALVTRIEQIDDVGQPLAGARRWATDPRPPTEFTISGYLRALLHGTPGHFRVIVFGVTAEPFSQSTASVTREETANWLREGLNSLPAPIGALAIDDRLRITALIYEFEISGTGGSPTFSMPGRLSGDDHLNNAGILARLKRL
ncbi:MAG TPA: hypothetical protein VIP11_02270 [Gemmatimonadaceae bacterium]